MNPDEQTTPADPVPVAMPAPTTSSGEPGTTSAKAATANNTLLMGILAYLGVLVFIPLIVAKGDPSVQFHVRQGLVLFIGEAIVWVVGNMGVLMYLGMIVVPILALLNLGFLVLSIIGIVNVVQKQQKELPLVGGLAKHMPL